MARDSAASGVATVKSSSAYLVVIEVGPESCSAYVPDLPGYIAAADTVEEVVQLVREGIPFHLEGLREKGDPIPRATTTFAVVEVENEGDPPGGRQSMRSGQ